jgi:hypothetical protein
MGSSARNRDRRLRADDFLGRDRFDQALAELVVAEAMQRTNDRVIARAILMRVTESIPHDLRIRSS